MCPSGIAPQIQDLYGKVQFTEEEISNMKTALDDYGLPMPQFKKIGGILADEMPGDEAAVHAAIIAINEAIETDSAQETVRALANPAVLLGMVCSSVLGIFAGYLGGAMVAGVFLLADVFRRQFVKPADSVTLPTNDDAIWDNED